jgi:hypothetical protein
MLDKITSKHFFIFLILTCSSIVLIHPFNAYFISTISGVLYSPLNLESSFIPYDELVIYGARVSEAFEGNLLLADSYTLEHQHKTYYLAPFFAEHIAAISLFLANAQPILANYLLDLVFPALIFVLVYKIFILLSTPAFFASFFSFLIIVFFDQLSVVTTSASMTQAINAFPNAQHLLTRSILAISLSAGLFALLRTLIFHHQPATKNFLLAILSNGILIYFNIFIFIFITLFNAASLFFIPNLSIKAFWKKLAVGAMLFFAVTFFYFYNQLSLAQNIMYDEILGRAGLTEIRAISMLSIVYIFLLILLFAFRKNIDSFPLMIVACTLISLIIAKNIQIILGFNPQIFHYDRDIGRWVFLIGFMAIIFKYLQDFILKPSKTICLLIGIILFTGVAITQLNFTKLNHPQYVLDKSLHDVFNFLNAHTKKNTVVAADTTITKWLPAFTHNNTLIAISPASMVNDQEAISRFVLAQRMLGFSDEAILAMHSYDLYVDLFHFHSLYVMSSIPMENLSLKKEAALDRFYNALQHYLQADSKNTHSVDYILFTRESASSNICCTIIFENDQFILTTSTISEND